MVYRTNLRFIRPSPDGEGGPPNGGGRGDFHSRKPLIKRFVTVFQPFPQRTLGPLPCLGTASEVTSSNYNLSIISFLNLCIFTDYTKTSI